MQRVAIVRERLNGPRVVRQRHGRQVLRAEAVDDLPCRGLRILDGPWIAQSPAARQRRHRIAAAQRSSITIAIMRRSERLFVATSADAALRQTGSGAPSSRTNSCTSTMSCGSPSSKASKSVTVSPRTGRRSCPGRRLPAGRRPRRAKDGRLDLGPILRGGRRRHEAGRKHGGDAWHQDHEFTRSRFTSSRVHEFTCSRVT